MIWSYITLPTLPYLKGDWEEMATQPGDPACIELSADYGKALKGKGYGIWSLSRAYPATL